MIVNLDTCEWERPGANPSMVTIEQAVARGVPEPDRAELLRQFNARQRFDLVRIKRDTIVSNTGAAQYAGLVSNMNFGSGGLCYTVTRNTWSATDEQWAMVFKVNGRYYGYAAVCRNLFTLVGKIPPVAAVPPPTATDQPFAPPMPEAPPVALLTPDAPPVETFEGAVVGFSWWFYGGGGYPGSLSTAPTPEPTPIPEPKIYVLYFAGLAALVVTLVRRERA